METSYSSNCLWPVLCFLLSAVAIFLLLRRHQDTTRPQPSRIVEMEDALKEIYHLQRGEAAVKSGALAQTMSVSNDIAEGLMQTLIASDWAKGDMDAGIRLTRRGQERAEELIRAHRLWERYLVERRGLLLEAVHTEAEHLEHETTPEKAAELDAELGYPAWDPHGDIIPDAGHPVPPSAGTPLPAYTQGERLRIVRVKNEPPALFAQLVAMGLKPGVEVQVVESQPDRLSIKVDGDIHPLAAVAAESIHAVPVPIMSVPLSELPVGSQAMVVEIGGSGRHQRRMLDMGLVPGAEVTAIRTAPLGDPIEYRVKGTAIAMRRADAKSIVVEERRSRASVKLKDLGRDRNAG